MNRTDAQMAGTARVRRPRRGAWRLSIACAAAALALVVAPGAAQAGTLDQQQTSFTGSQNVGGSTASGLLLDAQTFTAGLNGQLDRVDLRLAQNGSSSPLTVEIQEVSGGVPSGAVLASASVPTTISTALDWVSVPFGSPAPSVAGTQYAIVLRNPDCCYGVQVSGDNPYAAGAQHTSRDGGVTWSPTSVGQIDLAFKTYVAAPTFVFTGFAAPIDNGVVNSARAGQPIPVRYHLALADGTPVSDPASFVSLTSQSASGACAGLPSDAIETYVGNSGLLYLGNGNWQFNWKTPRSYAGQCRTMTLELSDGSTHTASFQFK